jgi:AAA15 family ATPase/GTPase
MEQLIIKNFRSIRDQRLSLAPVTIVYGPNGSGKSSLLYAPLVLRNLALNPTQSLSSLLNLGFMSMGDFKNVVFGHEVENTLELGIVASSRLGGHSGKYSYRTVFSSDNTLEFCSQFDADGLQVDLGAKVSASLPYGLSQHVDVHSALIDMPLRWNGLSWSPGGEIPADAQTKARQLLTELNRPVERLRRISFAPVNRGFFQVQYTTVTVAKPVLKDLELATLLVNDQDLEANVSVFLERICNRQFRARTQIGTSVFTLQVILPSRRLSIDLVNDGFGVNQLVYILTLALWKETDILIVEEPEIHLHPSMIREFMRAIVELAKSGKQFLLSTHSESLVSACLSLIARQEAAPEQFAFYLAGIDPEKGHTVFHRQEVNEKGQIDGGLESFMKAELEDLKALLRAEDSDS